MTPEQAAAARVRLDNARWDVNYWARVIAEGHTSTSEVAAVFIATPETHRRYTQAVADEAEAFAAWQAAEAQQVTA